MRVECLLLHQAVNQVLERLQALLVRLLVSWSCGLDCLVPSLNIRVFLEVNIGDFEAGDTGDEAQIGDGHVGSSHVLLTLEECVQVLQSLLNLGQLAGVSRGASEQLRVLARK